MVVEWQKCEGGIWCDLIKLNLHHEHFTGLSGVYLIWSGTTAVRVGSGIIKDRLEEHRNNDEITEFPDLKVTWAEVGDFHKLGVETYLADMYQPVIGERFPDLIPIEVNLPFE